MIGRQLQEGESFIEGRTYVVVSRGYHTHWAFYPHGTYVAGKRGLISITGDECYRVYGSMIIHIVSEDI